MYTRKKTKYVKKTYHCSTPTHFSVLSESEIYEISCIIITFSPGDEFVDFSESFNFIYI